MNTKTRLLALTATLALTAATAPSAWALQTEWVATGTVYSSYDDTGVFGPAGASLDGDSFTADFYIDTSKGYESIAPGEYDEVYGGTGSTTDTPVLGSLTINGITQTFDGSYDGYAYTQGGSEAYGYTSGYADDNLGNDLYVYVENGSIDSGYPTTIGQPFSVSANYGSANSGYGNFYLTDAIAGTETSGALYVDKFSSVSVSAAPEPAAWTLLIAGVGMAGAALRLGRRRGWATA